jgi:hypothetical protein
LRVSISKETNNLLQPVFYSILELKNILFVAVITQRGGKSCGNAGLSRFRRRLNARVFVWCRDKTSVCEFINILIADNYSVFYLLNYSRMYIDSKMITYAYLDYVSGADTNRSLMFSPARRGTYKSYFPVFGDNQGLCEPVLGDIPASGGAVYTVRPDSGPAEFTSPEDTQFGLGGVSKTCLTSAKARVGRAVRSKSPPSQRV